MTDYALLQGAVFSGSVSVPGLANAGLGSASVASRYVGGTASGAPVSGSFGVGDFVIDATGKIWICTTTGTPGTWTQTGGGGGVTSITAGTSASVSASVGAVTVSIPSGTFVSTPTATPGTLLGSPTLSAWYKASAITGLSNGASVGSWLDSSGNSITITYSGAASIAPIYYSALPHFNGLPGVTFSGNNYLVNTTTGIGSGSAFTYAVLLNVLAASWSGYAFEYRGTDYIRLYATTTNSNGWTSECGPPTNLTEYNSSLSGGVHLVIVTYDGTNQRIYHNGRSVAWGATTGAVTPSSFILGGTVPASPTPSFIGDIAEFALYTSVLTSAQIAALHNYYSATYALPFGSL